MTRLGVRLAFGALCLVSGSVWLLWTPSPMEATQSAAIAYTVLTLGSVMWLLNRRSSSIGGPSFRTLLLIASAAAGAIAGPLVLLSAGARGSTAALAVAALCTAPVWAALASSVLRGDALQRPLLPSMVALGGALLLLPITEPGSSRAASAALLCVAAAIMLGVSAVVCSSRMQEVSAATAFATGAGANAMVLWIAVVGRGAFRGVNLMGGSVLLQVGLDLLIGALMLGLLRAMPPLPLMTRFLWTPLIFAAEGCLVFRAPLTARMGVGAVLIGWGAASLLRERWSLPDEIPSLR